MAFHLLLCVCSATPASRQVPDGLRSSVKSVDVTTSARQELLNAITGGCPPNLTALVGYNKEDQILLKTKTTEKGNTTEQTSSYWIKDHKGVFGSSYVNGWTGDLGTSGQVIYFYLNGARESITCTSPLTGFGPNDWDWVVWRATPNVSVTKVPSWKCFDGADPASGNCVIVDYALTTSRTGFQSLHMDCQVDANTFCEYRLTHGWEQACQPDVEVWTCRKLKKNEWVYENVIPSPTASPKPTASISPGPQPSATPWVVPQSPCQNKSLWIDVYNSGFAEDAKQLKKEGYSTAVYALSGEWGDGSGGREPEGIAGLCHSMKVKAKLAAWAIVLIVIGVIVVITILLLICSCICKCGCCKD